MSSIRKQLKLAELLKEVLIEVGDLNNIEPYPLQYYSSADLASFKTKEGDLVQVGIEDATPYKYLLKIPPVFDPENSKIFSVVYTVEGRLSQHRKTSYRELAAILKTILEFTKKAVPEMEAKFEQGVIFSITSQSKYTEQGKTDPQKHALYSSIILNNLPQGYRNAETEFNGKPTIIFKKIK